MQDALIIIIGIIVALVKTGFYGLVVYACLCVISHHHKRGGE